MNTTEFLAISAAIVPDRQALVFEDRRTTFQALQNRVDRLPDGLAQLGVAPGDRVAMLQVNTDRYIEAYFATAKLDAVFVPLNFRSRAEELTYMLNDCTPNVLFAGARYADSVRSIAGDLVSVRHLVAMDEAVDGWLSYDDLVSTEADVERYPAADDQEIIEKSCILSNFLYSAKCSLDTV